MALQCASVITLLTTDTHEVLALPNFMVHRIIALAQRGLLLVDNFLRTSVHGDRYFHDLPEVLVGNCPKEPSEHWVRQVRREIVDEQAEEREAGEGRASRFNVIHPSQRQIQISRVNRHGHWQENVRRNAQKLLH